MDDGHTHAHTHSYTHVHAHSHEQEEGHDHTHPHDHDHTHEHEAHHHHHAHTAKAPVDQLTALMRYMAEHNASHTRELAELAQKVRDAGNEKAYAQAMEAVHCFDQGNKALSRALAEMNA